MVTEIIHVNQIFLVKFNNCPFTELSKKLKNYVYGQHLTEVIIHAISAHQSKFHKPRKALAMSFHGWPGSGKNYISNFIAESLYKYGTKSKFVHYFVGRVHFPLQQHVEEYKVS